MSLTFLFSTYKYSRQFFEIIYTEDKYFKVSSLQSLGIACPYMYYPKKKKACPYIYIYIKSIVHFQPKKRKEKKV